MSDPAWIAEVSENTRDILNDMGHFSPTINVKDCNLKGWQESGKEYWNSTFLREAAAAFIEAADWLDRRAGAVK